MLVERASVPGGLVRSEHLEGVLYEPHGSHIFHTEDREVWDLANRLTPFRHYRHRVDIVVEGKLLNWPILVSDIERQSRSEEIRRELRTREGIDPAARAAAANFEEWCIDLMGPILYERYIRPYTQKQWGRPPAELSASWAPRRVQVRWDDDPYLFPDPYQGWPAGPNGYTDLIDGLLASPLVEVRTGVDATLEGLDGLVRATGADAIVLTCPLDVFAGGRFGALEWRGIDVRSVHVPHVEYAQGAMVVNYPGLEYPFVRIHETKHASGQRCQGTVLGFEFTGAPSRYYPIETAANRALNDRYQSYLRDRIGPRLHFVATLMVAIGTLTSAFWILSANSWMQTPSGHAVNAAGQYIAVDWLKVIFNPSFPYRLVHMVLAAYLTTAFVVGAVGALHLLRDSHQAGARVMFSMAMWMATIVAPIQIIAGDQHGLNTLEHQPVKIMAMEGHFESHKDGAPLILFGLPDQAAGKVRYAVEVPKLGSLILKHSPDAPLAGLDTVPRENWPPVFLPFWSFRIMVGMGLLMAGLGLFSLVMRIRGKLYDSRLLHLFSVAMAPAGFVAVLAGWVTTEVGRQPFTVYGLLRTADAASPLASPAVASSLIAFVIVYFTVFTAGVVYILRLMASPPHPGEQGPSHQVPARAAGITPAAGAATGAIR